MRRYEDLYNSASHDPTQGRHAAALDLFSVHLTAAATPKEDVINTTIEAGIRSALLYLAQDSATDTVGYVDVVHHVTNHPRSFLQPTPWDDQLFGFKNDLAIDGQASSIVTVKVDDIGFACTNVLRVPKATLLAANAATTPRLDQL